MREAGQECAGRGQACCGLLRRPANMRRAPARVWCIPGAMLSQEELEQLLAASRSFDATELVGGSLPSVAATARQLLQLIEQTCPDDAQQEAMQHSLLLCLRVCRNAAATGGSEACCALVDVGLLGLVQSTLRLISSATISLNWELPAAVAQALANLCTACGASAAAAWAALFPLHLAMLAHVNAGRMGLGG